jgi:hypothetical protein
MNELRTKAKKARKEIEKIVQKGLVSSNVGNLVNNILADRNISLKGLDENELQVSKYAPPTFSRLNEEQKEVILEVFEILEDELDFDISELIKKRIVEKFN